MTTIVLDGLNEEDFRRSIENRLREGSAGAAIARLRALLAPYCAPGGMLPERFLTVAPMDLVLSGWDNLAESVLRHDKPGRPVTAISIAFGWPGDDVTVPDSEGRLRPHVETSYFSDNAYPFSQSGREDLLEGYSFYGCTWSGDSEASDNALTLQGIDDLHGALALLETRLLTSDEPDEEGIRAGSLGACLLSALLVQAVTERINHNALPRPLCVMAGSSGVYPYFDAPVAGMPEEARKAAAAQEEEVALELGAPAPRYSSLLMAGIPRAKKRAVLVLDESDDEMTNRIARLRGMSQADSEEAPTLQQDIPAVDAYEMPEAAAAAAGSGPLLAKKPARDGRDLHDILGLSVPGFSPDETPGREPAESDDDWDDWAEPAESAVPAEWAERAEPVNWDEPTEQARIDVWNEPAEPQVPADLGAPVDRFELVDWPIPAEEAATDEPVDQSEPLQRSEPVDWSDWSKPAVQSEPAYDSEPVDWSEAVPPPADSEPAAVPGFTLLDANLQQRLQFFLTNSALPIAEAPDSAVRIPAGQSAPAWPDTPGGVEEKPEELAPAEPTNLLVRTTSSDSLRVRLRDMIKAMLARFGL